MESTHYTLNITLYIYIKLYIINMRLIQYKYRMTNIPPLLLESTRVNCSLTCDTCREYEHQDCDDTSHSQI